MTLRRGFGGSALGCFSGSLCVALLALALSCLILISHLTNDRILSYVPDLDFLLRGEIPGSTRVLLGSVGLEFCEGSSIVVPRLFLCKSFAAGTVESFARAVALGETAQLRSLSNVCRGLAWFVTVRLDRLRP